MLRHLGGRLRRLSRKTWSHVAKRLFRDDAGGPERTVLVAGVARSGTTWLAEILCEQLSARLLFEPFHPHRVAEYRDFEYQQYMRPGQENEALFPFVDNVLRGTIRDPLWIDRMADRLRPDYRVVKAVRANFMLRWIHDRFPMTPALLIVRHPCAVVASFQKLGWTADPDLASISRQPDLIGDHLEGYADLIATATLPHQRTALLWSAANRVALDQCGASGVVRLYYENLTRHPDQVIPRIFAAIGHEYDASLFAHLRRPSGTAKFVPSAPSDRVAGWTTELSKAQIDDVLEIASAFGLGGLYLSDGAPAGTLNEVF